MCDERMDIKLMQVSAVEVSNVTMRYRLASEKIDSFKYYFIKKMKRQIHYKDFEALKNVSFSVNKGEVFGVIGMNGAGKSTLLKVIAGVLKPTSGTVDKKGGVAPLLELGAGFNEDLTGVENIFLNGLLLGYSRKFLREKLDEIVDFSELGDFIYTPIKNYSSGMKARLGFAISTAVQPDIIILDEVLSVGDVTFKDKSEAKINSMIKNDTTVIFVSHSLEQVERLCDRVLWLERGTIRAIGETREVLNEFKNNRN